MPETAPTEPLERTLEEFIKDVAAKYPHGGLVWLDVPGTYPRKAWFITDDLTEFEVLTDFARNWRDLAEQFYGREVVARDDVAELSAAGHQSVRLIEWLSSREGTALEDAAEAEALVNRLRAALAATEGSEP